MMRRAVPAGFALLLALTGCSSGSPAPTPSTPSPTGSAQMLPPIFIDADTSAVEVEVGKVLVVTTKHVTRIGTDQPAVLEVVQGGDQGTYTTNPGATARSAGNALLQVYDDSGLMYQVDVTVTP